jgi:hypothetical protein
MLLLKEVLVSFPKSLPHFHLGGWDEKILLSGRKGCNKSSAREVRFIDVICTEKLVALSLF